MKQNLFFFKLSLLCTQLLDSCSGFPGVPAAESLLLFDNQVLHTYLYYARLHFTRIIYSVVSYAIMVPFGSE